MHLYIYNHGQKTEVSLPRQGGDWLFYKPGTKYYALSFNDLHITDKPLFATQAAIGACVRTALVKGITCMVPLALYGDLYYTYLKTAEQARLNELKQHIARAKTDITSPDTRLSDVAIAWNVFQHFFPYWSDASKTPQQLFHDALIKTYTDKNANDFFYTTKLMCTTLNDGHMFYNSNGINEASAPLILARAKGKMVIRFVLDSALNSSISARDVIDAVDGQEAILVLKQKMQYMSGSPQCKERDALTYLLTGPKAKPVSLTLHHQDKIVSLSVNRGSPPAFFRPGNFSLNPVHNGLLKDGIYYYDLSGDSVLAEIRRQLPQLLQAKAVIMDMRGYPKASMESLICQLLKHDKTATGCMGRNIFIRIISRLSTILWIGNSDGLLHIGTRIYHLIDASTQSAAESYSGYFKDFKLATIIGRPTAGANGGIAEFRLPAMNNRFYSGQLVTNHDGSKEHINGIIPDIVVEPTIKGITEGRDEILERAIAEAEKASTK
ncbi:MAG: peptidase [Chitinophagaceae bacterium]|nr:peptidase [Chitinophagaceae bacterium]